MGPTTTRLATAMDAEAAVIVMRRSIAELCGPDHRNEPARLEGWLANKTPAHFRAWLADPSNTMIVAVRDDGVVGVAGLRAGFGITANYVHPEARWSGVSGAMMTRLESMLAETGAPVAYLTSTETALPFYIARGYTIRALSAAQRPVYGIAMEKRLAPAGGDGDAQLSRSAM